MATASHTAPNPSISAVAATTDTTAKGGDVFPRASRRALITGQTNGGYALGSMINPIGQPVPGYLRAYRQRIVASGGVAGEDVDVAAAQDAPWSVIGNYILRDIRGTQAVVSDGFGLFLLNTFGGQLGMLGYGNNLVDNPSYSAMDDNGNFSFIIDVPLEFGYAGYCSWPLQNAASLPTQQIPINPSSSVYSTAPDTLPTITLTSDLDYWVSPQGNENLGPEDVGASHQWMQSQITSVVQSASYQNFLQWPTVGTYIDTAVAVLRDSTGARIAAWPENDLQLWVDNEQVWQYTFDEYADLCYKQFAIDITSDAFAGVLPISFRDSLTTAVSPLDNLDLLLQTAPATNIVLKGTFGTIDNAPARIITYTGLLYPLGAEPEYGIPA